MNDATIAVVVLGVAVVAQAIMLSYVCRRMLNTLAALAGSGRDLAQIERATNPPRTQEKPAPAPALDERV